MDQVTSSALNDYEYMAEKQVHGEKCHCMGCMLANGNVQ